MSDQLYFVKAPAYAMLNSHGDKVAMVVGRGSEDDVLHEVGMHIMGEELILPDTPEGNGTVGVNLTKVKQQTTVFHVGEIPFELLESFDECYQMDIIRLPEK